MGSDWKKPRKSVPHEQYYDGSQGNGTQKYGGRPTGSVKMSFHMAAGPRGTTQKHVLNAVSDVKEVAER